MQGRGGGRDPFFDFANAFPGFGNVFEEHRSMMSGFFGGRDPFDDPFFSRPSGGMFGSSTFGPGGSPFGLAGSPFGLAGSPFGLGGGPFGPMHPSAFIEDQPQQVERSRGPIIEELDSDAEENEADAQKKENSRKHGRSGKEPYVEEPNNDSEVKRSKILQHRNENNRLNHMEAHPQTHSFTFQSSTVSYGGANGTYYTSSKTRRNGSDGVAFEESKEADSSTGKATHRISRGMHSKGHTLTRKLESDGRVDTVQTLHNLDQGELPSFEEAWRGKARHHLPGWTGTYADPTNIGAIGNGENLQANRGGWALPSTERSQQAERMVGGGRENAGSSQRHQAQSMNGSSQVRDKSKSQWKSRN